MHAREPTQLIENCSFSFVSLRNSYTRVLSPVPQYRLKSIENPAVCSAPCFYDSVIVRLCGTGAHVVTGAVYPRL